MSEDHEGDSHMLSSPSISTISPPSSQPRETMPVNSAMGANSNGKRPLGTMSNGEEASSIATTKPRPDFPTKTHAASGYKWSRAEDEPGFAWTNEKALSEAGRAWDALVHKECMVQNRYGDIFEIVEKEKASRASREAQ